MIDEGQEKHAVCAHNLKNPCTVLQIDVPLHRQKERKGSECRLISQYITQIKKRKDRIMIKNVLVWMVQHTPITEFYAEA